MTQIKPRASLAKRLLKHFLLTLLLLIIIALVIAGFLVAREAKTSTYQAEYLSKLAKDLKYEVKDGPNPHFKIPQAGPYDIRMGYSLEQAMIPRLAGEGFQVTAQARLSPRMQELIDEGLFAPYKEKTQAGLSIIDDNGNSLHKAIFPHRIYSNFETVPPIVTQSLLFIENRELLDPTQPKKNPAIEWERLARAVLDKAIQYIRPEHDVPGGSTLATQIEKYRHSPDGLTLTAKDKLQQMASASVRAYLDGEQTMPARKRIVVDYLNTVPLAGVAGFGEVNGIGDGLWAWYGLDFKKVNQLLQAWPSDNANLNETASAYKHLLSLMIAQRRPSGYLVSERKALEALTNSHIRLLAQEGVISPALKNAAIKTPLHFTKGAPSESTDDFTILKATNAVRVRLASLLGLSRMYELDHLDLSVRSTLDGNIQKNVTAILKKFNDPEYARNAGLYGERLLGSADPGKIIYSLTFYELTPQGAKLRVQADNFDQPFDINKGAKLDLGSTAKLRTLVTYLEIVGTLHDKYAASDPKELREVTVGPNDVITRWAIDYLLTNEDKSLSNMLDAAMERKYSANPHEQFFTGGGAQFFNNFKHDDDSKIISVREATRNSVNLVFIRLMRDVVRYYTFQTPGSTANVLKDIDAPQRTEYLNRFADKEGKAFIARFYQKYKGKPVEEVMNTFLAEIHPTPRRLSAAFRYIYPAAGFDAYEKFMTDHLPSERISGKRTLQGLFDSYPPGKYSLSDQGYIAHVHPLELWLVQYLVSHPGSGYNDVIKASSKERIAVYDWLRKTSHKNAQDIRIRSLLEVEAFLEIHKSWKRLGYPFDSLVPSLATAIGSSADRPAALAELMGIILNNGAKVPTVLIEQMHFGKDTPFETIIKPAPVKSVQLFAPEIAEKVRAAIIDVVEKGTASRLAHAIVREDGTQIPIGGKTGTGDHRYVTFSSVGVIKDSRSVNRSATFVFFIGDRFFGTLTAFIPGADASQYHFTSALSAQALKHLLPTLKPLTDQAKQLPEQILAAEMQPKKAAPSKAKPKAPNVDDEAIENTPDEVTDKEE
ncbi:transglycosylase domain-containing protein [Sulfurirhabdus autotrophica]|uniref:peptidoglycan glycosyltransferase n=1 Tax=Sulfurirhabdus autotrophica TaxID=1706046 RepID=A0A4R3XQ37_9PROT|nr:transglycosylase domain-containing protein [Sulfurirhabdus autotrophica]TCV80215.1 membrane peptidoglycan carboxypeptidase [Sulfurirhabdus autotrophica]